MERLLSANWQGFLSPADQISVSQGGAAASKNRSAKHQEVNLVLVTPTLSPPGMLLILRCGLVSDRGRTTTMQMKVKKRMGVLALTQSTPANDDTDPLWLAGRLTSRVQAWPRVHREAIF